MVKSMRPEIALFIERALILEKWNMDSISKKRFDSVIMDDAIKTAKQLSFVLSDEIENREMVSE
jgi:hypothetical protein